MSFPSKYFDPDLYISLSTAADRAQCSFSYMSRLVSSGRIERAPTDQVIMVSVASFNRFFPRLSATQREALELAANYGTVHGAHRNHGGPKAGAINGAAANQLVEMGYLERLNDYKNLHMFCITEKGKERVG